MFDMVYKGFGSIWRCITIYSVYTIILYASLRLLFLLKSVLLQLAFGSVSLWQTSPLPIHFHCQNLYRIFTKFLRNFYEIFTKFLRNFYEIFLRIFYWGFFKHSKNFARGSVSTLIFFDVKSFSTSKICRLVLQSLNFLTRSKWEFLKWKSCDCNCKNQSEDPRPGPFSFVTIRTKTNKRLLQYEQ